MLVHFAVDNGGKVISNITENPEHVESAGGTIQSADVYLGDDLGLFNFQQMPNGRWAGTSPGGVYVTLFSFAQGERPERFKYELYLSASKAESDWYASQERTTGKSV